MTQRHGVEVYPHVAGWAAEMAAKPRTDEHIADAVATVVRLSHDELLTLLEAAKDAERHARIWDSIEAQLRVAQ